MREQLFIGYEKPNPARMNAVENKQYGFVKPTGGLWTSTYRPDEPVGSGWGEWCIEADYRDIYASSWWLLTPSEESRIVTINTLKDLKALMREYKYCPHGAPYPDFEAISRDYDAIHLTDKGQCETRLSMPENLYGWDCESTLWFRWVFTEVTQIPVKAGV